MRKLGYFYRNARSGELLELFLVAAVLSLLGTRFGLHLVGYPTLGGHSLHIAHMLYGGLLMMTAMVIFIVFIGFRAQRLASLIAGIGFGLFIDELGKFITRDNNYFYSPTIGFIYLIFVALFLTFRWLGRTRQLTPRENLLNALVLSEEVVIEDLDAAERRQVLDYLSQADQSHPLVGALTEALKQAPTAEPSQQALWRRWQQWSQRAYERVVTHRYGRYLLDAVFVGQAAWMVSLLVVDMLHPSSHPTPSHVPYAEVLDFWSSVVSAGFMSIGVISFRKARLWRYNLFAISLLIDIFVTHFFEFYQDQFEALPSLVMSVLLYLGVRFVIDHERRRQLAR